MFGAFVALVVGSFAIESITSGFELAVRVGVALSIAEGLLFLLLTFIIVGRSPARLWRIENGFAFDAHRLAGGLLSASEIRVKSSDVNVLVRLGRLDVVLGAAATATRDGRAARTYYDQIILDGRVARELGFETDSLSTVIPKSETWTTLSVRDLGGTQRRIGQILALTGCIMAIASILAIAGSRDFPSIQGYLQGILVAATSIVVLGIALGVVGSFWAARGRKN